MNKNTLVKKHKDNSLETVPYILSRISAGFPSPADDYIENNLSISELLIKNQLSTFLMKASGESMIEAGINDGDVLVVDRSLEARSRDIVIAIFEGNLTVKRLIIKADGSAILKSENPLYKNILISEYTELEIWGVVTSAIHQFIK
ncbi:translesion error-prone DNA polymerase V autoproteolytic subunit [Alphaproteobacteria bacterium]|jgi:DNA polymerase V|nr:translesion error-prone DNA polymerase V autoproteolytic subunit [Alphaproteobacteria bacterium]MDC3146791.1 translesion error-prone DNA polymerase V autoproteolytic subunit [Alphaproteobacteria bacterium]|tara:strand:+ start:257 stop:694 length:438 start_codon:yes stop_codon:yes gene_type:complete